jgi:FixJ family two-component response regulator
VDKKRLVLVVEDNDLVREAIAELLRSSAAIEVRTFASAEDLLSVGVDKSVRCSIIDLGLPGMSGWALHRELARVSCPPVIFITACDDPNGDLKRMAVKAGAIAFFRKPIDGEQLISAVRQALNAEAEPALGHGGCQ